MSKPKLPIANRLRTRIADIRAFSKGNPSLIQCSDLMDEAVVEIDTLTADLLALRTAIVRWDTATGEKRDRLRDEIAAYLESKYGDDRPYPPADHLLGMFAQGENKVDQILFDVIPENTAAVWGVEP